MSNFAYALLKEDTLALVHKAWLYVWGGGGVHRM